MTVDHFGFDENVLREDSLQVGVLDMFNTQQEMFPKTSFSDFNQTLDTDF
jgi:hypothetical protein